MAVTLIGGTIGGTVLTLLFLPALYAIWFRIRAADEEFPVARMQPAS
jgi:Cu/Ag efflux pump CusA